MPRLSQFYGCASRDWFGREQVMMLRIPKAEVAGPHHLDLSFNDGEQGAVNFEPLLSGRVFEPLREPGYFARVALDPICGTVVWPNGAGFAPEALHALMPVELPARKQRSPQTR